MYDLQTDLGRVRLLISDLADDGQPGQVFTDSEIGAFLQMETSVKAAAAQALDTIADNEALTSKVIQTQDLSVDGAKVADSLRKRAQALRDQVATAPAQAEEEGYAFEVVPGFPRHCAPELTEHVWPW